MDKIQDKTWKEKLEKVKLLILDVDGVLTDGRIIMDDNGREIKHFDVRDGHGIKLLQRYGIDVVFLTGRRSAVVEHRARELGITHVVQGARDKRVALLDLAERIGIDPAAMAYMGDDVNDVDCLRAAGLAFAPADAVPEAKSAADFVTSAKGGGGAVREAAEYIISLNARCEGRSSVAEERP